MPDAFVLTGRVNVDTSAAERGLQALGQQVAGFGQSVRDGLAIGAGIAAFQEGLHLLAEGFGALKGSAIDFNQTLDGARAQMGRFFKTTDDLNNSIANLNDLAAKTPFAFEGLLTAQQRTIGAARSADELRQNMDAIAVASANTGRVSTANMDRISLALGQMQSKGHLAGGEMLQLTEAGVNMGEILAKHFGVSTAKIQEMVTAGKIGSQDVFAALRENAADPRNREALDKLAHTWEGALSTIGDVGRTVIAGTFRPLFDLMTEGAVAVADFLQSADFKAWAEAARLGFEAISNGVKSLLGFFEPLGTAIGAAFHQLTEGDFSGAFATISAGFARQTDLIWGQVKAFADGMFGGGANAIIAFADGMLSGGMAAIQGAIDAITSFIASVLMGNSPPPAGPLSTIDKGGANVAAAWVEPFGAVLKQGVTGAVEGAKATIDGLHAASRDVAGQIREITEQSQGLDRVMKGLKGTIDDLKAGFAAQKQAITDVADATKERYATAIQGVRDQIDTIKDRHQQAADAIQRQIDHIKDGYTSDIDAIKDAIGAIKDSYAELEAPVQRQIDLVKDKYGDALDGIRERIARIKDVESARLDPLQKQLALIEGANKLVRERQDAERAISNAKIQQLQLEALGDPKVRAQLAGQLAGLSAQQQQVDLAKELADAQEQLAKGGLSDNERKSLELKIQQLRIQQQLASMVDATKLAEATRQSELASAQEKQLGATRAIEDAHNRILAIPLKQKIDQIQAAAEAALKPLNAQLRDTEVAQKRALDPLQDKLKALKAEEQNLLLPLQSRLHDLEYDQRNALEPLQRRLHDIKQDERDALAPLEQQLKGLQHESDLWGRVFSAALKDVDRQQREALGPLQQQLDAYQHQKDALTEQKQELERIKQEIAETISMQQEAARAAKNAPGAAVAGAPAGGIDFQPDAATAAAAERWKSAGANLASKLGEGFSGWWATNKDSIIERIVGFFAGGALFGPIGAIAGATFLPEFIRSLNEKLAAGGFDAQPFIDALTKGAQTGDYTGLAEEIAHGVARGTLRATGAIGDEIGKAVARWFIPSADDQRSVGRAIVDGIFKGVGDWWDAYVLDFQTRVKKFTDVLDKYALSIAMALRRVFGLPETGPITGASPETKAIGDSLNQGLEDSIKNDDGIVGACYQLGGKIIAAFKWVFGIASPSTVMAEIGESLIDGLLGGVTQKWTDLKTWWEELPGKITSAFGWSGGGFTWVADLKAMGSTLLTNIWEGSDGYWQSNLSKWWTDLPKNIQTAFGWTGGALSWVGDLKTIGSTMLTNVWDGLDDYWRNNLSKWWADLPRQIQTAYGWAGGALTWAGDLLASGRAVLAGLWTGTDEYWQHNLQPWWAGFKGSIFAAMGLTSAYAGGAVDWLKDAGHQVLQSFWDGLNELWGSEGQPGTVKGLIKEITDWIPSWIKDALGVKSPSTVMHSIGHNVMAGLVSGIRSKFPDLQSTIREAMSHISNWGGVGFPGGALTSDALDGLLQTAIQIAGVGQDWLGGLRWLVEHEDSSLDPTAQNPEAVIGPDGVNYGHATGLGQLLPGTFAGNRDPNLPDDITNPLANLVAMIHYIQGTYYSTGRDLDWITEHWAERGGYAAGGWAGLKGPELAWLGERGPELVIPNAALPSLLAPSGRGAAGLDAPMQTIRIVVEKPSGRESEEIYVTGREMAIRRGRVPSGAL